MRLLVALTVVVVAGCDCRPKVSQVVETPISVAPAALDFGTVWLGQASERSVTVTNPNRTTVVVPVTTSTAPFAVAVTSPLSLPAGASVDVAVTFAPETAGEFDAEVGFAQTRVALHGVARAVPDCSTAESCRVAAFDFDAGVCVVGLAPEDADCATPLTCFTAARCHQGVCLGTDTTCDDGDPCTLDVCGASGCGHLDDSLSCPASTDLCLAPTCTPGVGCGVTPVVDGTACGPRTCTQAKVCIAGQCVARAAPLTQSCAEVVAGWPAGRGFTDGQGQDARLRADTFTHFTTMAYGADGTLFVCDTSTVRSVSADGQVKTIAGVHDHYGQLNGFGAAARLDFARLVGFDPKGRLLVAETGGLGPNHALVVRKVAPQGLVSSWVGNSACTDRTPDGGIGSAACLGTTSSIVAQTELGDLLVRAQPAYGKVAIHRITPLGEISFVGEFSKVDALFDPSVVLGLDQRVHLCSTLADAGVRDETFDGVVTTGDACPTPYSWSAGHLVRRADGQVVVGTGPASDGPISDAGLSWVAYPFAVDRDGGVAVFDVARSHIRRVDGAFIRTLAGPVAREGHRDGTDALLESSPRSLSVEGDTLFFADHGIRSFTPSAGVLTLVTESSPTCVNEMSFAYANGRAALACFEKGLRVYDGFSSAPTTLGAPFDQFAVSDVAVLPDAGLVFMSGQSVFQATAPDGGFELLANSAFSLTRIKAKVGGVYATDRSRVFQVTDGGTDVVATSQPAFEVLDFELAQDGSFYAIEPAGNRLLRLWPNTSPPRVETVMVLSDGPSSLALDGDGGVYLAVPNALLHARLP